MHINKDIKNGILTWLAGKASLEYLGRFDPQELIRAVIAVRLEAHLLWRLGQMLDSNPDYSDDIQEIRALLQRQCVFNAANNLRMDVEARAICRQMNSEGIRVMLLKGAAFRARYSELAGRPQCDTDIMIEREQLERAEEILQMDGFQVDTKAFTRQEYLEKHFNLRMVKNQHAMELHWAMDNRCRNGATERTWQRAEKVSWGEVPVYLPSVEDQFVFSIVHITRHLFSHSLRWFGDLVFEMERWPGIHIRLDDIAQDWPTKAVASPLLVARALDLHVQENVQLSNSIPAYDGFFLSRICKPILWGDNWLGHSWDLWAYALNDWINDEKSHLPQKMVRALTLRLRGNQESPWEK